MALTVENGTLVANANSYVSAANYTAWADARGFTYPGLPELEQKILRAMDYIESLQFVGLWVTLLQSCVISVLIFIRGPTHAAGWCLLFDFSVNLTF